MTLLDDYNSGIRYIISQNLKIMEGARPSNLPISKILIGYDGNAPRCRRERSNGKYFWKMWINENHPIKILINHEVVTEVDFSLKFEAEEGEFLKIKDYNIELRLWSNKNQYCYREDFDAPSIGSAVKTGLFKRVMMRFHFDIRRSKVSIQEPYFHFHVGGKNKPEEYCWIPKSIEVPRFPHPPMDIILLLEYIFVNFFRKESEELRSKSEWIEIVRRSQKLFQEQYFNKCKDFLGNDNDTLLGHSLKYRLDSA